MNVRTAWICCLLAGTVIFHCEGIQWLGLYRHSRPKKDHPMPHRGTEAAFTPSECIKARSEFGFRKRQLRFCRNDKLGNAMVAILNAAKIAIYHCGRTFSDRRWNCSSARHLPKLRPDLQRGTREQAFVYAFASAAMVYAIARGCADDSIKYCGCDYFPDNRTLPNSTYHWGDCHDNVEVAEKYVMDFLGLRSTKSTKRKRNKQYSSFEREPLEDLYRPPASRTRRHQKRKRRRKRTVLKLMNNHNYMAGIRIMDKRRKLFCKCHGVSGSCSVRTCSYRVRRIDDQELIRTLRDSYLKAIWVKRESHRLVPVSQSQRDTILPTDLVFVKHSPDYCLPDKEVGSFGTRGRKCNASLSGSFNCENMCCGRGFSIFRKQIIDNKCHCKFSTETFKVICIPCKKIITHHICN